MEEAETSHLNKITLRVILHVVDEICAVNVPQMFHLADNPEVLERNNFKHRAVPDYFFLLDFLLIDYWITILIKLNRTTDSFFHIRIFTNISKPILLRDCFSICYEIPNIFINGSIPTLLFVGILIDHPVNEFFFVFFLYFRNF